MALRRAAQRLHGVAASITRREIGSETARIAFASHRASALGAPSSPSSQQQCRRAMSHRPEDSVYGGPRPAEPRMTLKRLRAKYDNGERISVVTAYDYPSAVHVDSAGIDVALVGDSAAMVVHGHDTTLPITLDEMLSHCKAVSRGASRPLLVGDLPFGSYEQSAAQAIEAATRMLKEGGMDAVKLEGGSPSRVKTAKALVDSGIAVMGHVGLTPQSISVLGGFRPQGRSFETAAQVVERAMELERAGCFAIVIECVPRTVAAAVTAATSVPTIGIGAGDATSGQVLVYHDLLGMMQHPHHAKVTPKFCKQYANVGEVITGALERFKDEVSTGEFPGMSYSPYRVSDEDSNRLVRLLEQKGLDAAAEAVLDCPYREDGGK